MNRWLVACGAFVLTVAVSVAFAQDPKSKQGRSGQGKPDPATLFKLADKDGDGKISLDEFKGFITAMAERRAGGGRGKPDQGGGSGSTKSDGPAGKTGPAGKPGAGGEFAEKIFKKLDVNSHGSLSPEEFAKFFELMAEMRSKGKPGREKPQQDK